MATATAPALKRKAFIGANYGLGRVEYKVLDEDKGIVEGFVSVYGVKDSMDEIVDYGAFAKSLSRKMPRVAWSHDWQTVVGKTIDGTVEVAAGTKGLPESISRFGGLKCVMQFNLDTQAGRETFSNIKGGYVDEFSIGYEEVRVIEAKDSKDGVRHLVELNLYEVSPVLAGANPATIVTGVKGRKPRKQGKAAEEYTDGSYSGDLHVHDHPHEHSAAGETMTHDHPHVHDHAHGADDGEPTARESDGAGDHVHAHDHAHELSDVHTHGHVHDHDHAHAGDEEGDGMGEMHAPTPLQKRIGNVMESRKGALAEELAEPDTLLAAFCDAACDLMYGEYDGDTYVAPASGPDLREALGALADEFATLIRAGAEKSLHFRAANTQDNLGRLQQIHDLSHDMADSAGHDLHAGRNDGAGEEGKEPPKDGGDEQGEGKSKQVADAPAGNGTASVDAATEKRLTSLEEAMTGPLAAIAKTLRDLGVLDTTTEGTTK